MRVSKTAKKAIKAGADLTNEKLIEKITTLVNGGVTAENIGLLCAYTAMLSSTFGVDCEVETNKAVGEIIEKLKDAEKSETLSSVSDKI